LPTAVGFAPKRLGIASGNGVGDFVGGVAGLAKTRRQFVFGQAPAVAGVINANKL
jgi:hypothetical protein